MKTLGLSDVIGPIMVGPSSSHTAGALPNAVSFTQLTRPTSEPEVNPVVLRLIKKIKSLIHI